MIKSGIYRIINLINGKYYIGSAVALKNRWRTHKSRLNKGNHGNRYLQSSWNKYGAAAFEFQILERCEKNCLVKLEQYWIDVTKSADREFGYNLSPTAGNCLGVKHTEEVKFKKSQYKGWKHTEEAKLKMSLMARGNKNSLGMKQKPRSIEHRKAISLGNKGKKHSLETIEKRKISNAGFKHTEHTKNLLSVMHLNNNYGRNINRWPCPDGSYCECEKCSKQRKSEQAMRNAKRVPKFITSLEPPKPNGAANGSA